MAEVGEFTVVGNLPRAKGFRQGETRCKVEGQQHTCIL